MCEAAVGEGSGSGDASGDDASGDASGDATGVECDSCDDTKFGCCADGLRAASGPFQEGCEPEESRSKTTFL